MERLKRLIEEGTSLLRQGNWQRASKVFQEALDLLDKPILSPEEKAMLANVLSKKGHADSRMAQLQRARDQLTRSIEISSTIEDVKYQAHAFRGLGYVFALEGNVEEAVKNYERALEKAEQCQDMELKGRIKIDIGNAFFHKYDFERAKKEYSDAIKLLESIGEKSELARAYNNLGEAFKKTGDLEESIEHLRHSMDIATEIGDLAMKGLAALNAAECFTQMDEGRIAKEYLARALDLLETAKDRIGIVHTWMIYGLTFLMEKDYPRAEEAFKKSIQFAREAEIPIVEGEVLRKLADVYIGLDDIEKAKEALLRAIEIFDEKGRGKDAEEAREFLDNMGRLLDDR
jgi:tetratricopeptide (TPR) repeat protein